MGQLIRLAGIATDTGRRDILPGRLASLVPGDHMIKIQIALWKIVTAILAGKLITQENVAPREFHLLAGDAVIEGQNDDPGDAEGMPYRPDQFPGEMIGRMLRP